MVYDAMSGVSAIRDLDPANYVPHLLHAADRLWTEKNCYVDVWIELLHAVRREPLAMLGFTAAIDFTGDQWTFFKPSHDDLQRLYGVDVQELNIWRPLLDHAMEYLRRGTLISTEADAFWLPDTAGTDYRRQHTKSTIVINDIDRDGRRLGYFHNAGYFHLDGADFEGLFRFDAADDPAFMPLFAEAVRIDRLKDRSDQELRVAAAELLRKYVERLPAANPVTAYERRFHQDLPEVQGRGLDYYHAWAFATSRQLGSAAELLCLHLTWLDSETFAAASAAFQQIASGSKTLILKGARAVSRRKPMDGEPLFAELADAWQRGVTHLREAVERRAQP